MESSDFMNNQSDNNTTFTESIYFLELSIKVKVIATLIVLVFGLLGHFLTIFVFSQKRFRLNSSNVFLLCLAINDGLYLIIHFFEETIVATKDVFISLSSHLSVIVS